MRTMNEPSVHDELRPFRRAHAPLVAGWVRDDDELFWLAPQTMPPLTPQKVIDWTARRGRPMLLCTSDRTEPVGYAELNDLPSRADELWIGHFIIAPERRGAGLGGRMLRLLLDHAFGPLTARRVALIVFPENVLAIRCYESGGLATAGRQERNFSPRPGTHRMLEMAIDQAGYRALMARTRPPVGNR